MKKRIYILLIMLTMCCVAVRADVWKSHKWLNRSTSSGKSWNYTGAKLNGITHGGGIYESNPYQRTNYNEDNGMMSSKDYGVAARNAMNSQSRKASSYNVSFSGEPVRKSNFHIVSGKVSDGNAKRNGGGFSCGTSPVKTYRYGRREMKYDETVNLDVNVKVKYLPGKEVTVNEVSDEDCGRMKSAARDELGNSKSPKASPFGDLPELKTFDRNGGLGPAAKPIFDGPLSDGLIPLLLMAGLFAALKRRNNP